MQLSQNSGLLASRELCKDPVSESFDNQFTDLVADVRVDQVLAVDAKLTQSLVSGTAPLCKH